MLFFTWGSNAMFSSTGMLGSEEVDEGMLADVHANALRILRSSVDRQVGVRPTDSAFPITAY
jgi:hypothetical protein